LDLKTGQIQRTLTGHTNAVYKPSFSPDEKLLASSGRDLTRRRYCSLERYVIQ